MSWAEFYLFYFPGMAIFAIIFLVVVSVMNPGKKIVDCFEGDFPSVLLSSCIIWPAVATAAVVFSALALLLVMGNYCFYKPTQYLGRYIKRLPNSKEQLS